MNLSQINALLRNASLPTLSDVQLQSLDAIGERKQFDANVIESACGDQEAMRYLELVVRSLSTSLPSMLAELGLAYDPRSFIDTAKTHRMNLFAALHAYKTKPEERDRAARFIRSLGLPAAGDGHKPTKSEAVDNPPYYSFKVFGQSAALCISEARTRIGALHTVQIEGAGVLSGGPSRRYDWPNKIIVQLTPQEAYQLLALLEHHVDMVKFDGHGPRHDKSLHIEMQGNLYFAKLFQKGRAAIMVPVRPAEAMPLISLLYKQILLNEPHLDITAVQQMVGRMGSMIGAPATRRSPA